MEIILTITNIDGAKVAIRMLQSYVDGEKQKPLSCQEFDPSLSIEDLDLPFRTMNCLKSDEIKTIEQLLCRRPSEMLKVPNLGRKSLNEIILRLRERNLHLAF